MKTLNKIIGVAALAFGVAAVASNNKKTIKKKLKFLFVGDSLTFGFGLNGLSFVDKLKQKYPNIEVKKIAITGKQTSWMLAQLKDELESSSYDFITIWGGINDIYAKNSIASAKENLQKMFDMANNSGAKVIALNVIPSKTYKHSNASTASLTKSLNTWLNNNTSVSILLDVNTLVNNGADGV